MAHWAELDDNNYVLRVIVTRNDDENGDEGYKWLIDNLGGRWVQTSYTSYHGKRRHPDTLVVIDEPAFRKNFAGIGSFYDEEKDEFIFPRPSDGDWILDETIGDWVKP
jgi:hypothetical protein